MCKGASTAAPSCSSLRSVCGTDELEHALVPAGAELEAWMERNGGWDSFDKVVYVGDGSNDLCPVLHLRECVSLSLFLLHGLFLSSSLTLALARTPAGRTSPSCACIASCTAGCRTRRPRTSATSSARRRPGAAHGRSRSGSRRSSRRGTSRCERARGVEKTAGRVDMQCSVICASSSARECM